MEKTHIKYRLTVVNQLSEKLSQVKETQLWLDQKVPFKCYPELIPLTKLHAKDGGFLVNNEVKIVAEVEVLEVINKLDVSVKSQEVTQPRKKTKLNDDGDVSSHLHTETSSVRGTIDVNGFQVLPSQAESVKCIFERHPEIASECRIKNQDLRTSYMNILLSIIKMLFKSPQDASMDDLSDVEAALAYMKNVGFKLDWLEKKLDQVKENKKKCARVCSSMFRDFTETQQRFTEKYWSWGFSHMLLLTKLHERDSGFLVNGELKITAEVDVLETEESKGTTQPLKKRKQDNDSMLSMDF